MPEHGIVWMSRVHWGLGEFKGRLENFQRRQKITAVDGKQTKKLITYFQNMAKGMIKGF